MQHKRYTWTKLVRLIASVTALIVLLVVAELAARNWLIANRPSRFVIFADHTPTAYANSAYYSLVFLSEQSKAVRSLYLDQDGELTSGFHGEWYNFDDGIRRTTGQPSQAMHTVYVFGNSTMLSLEVPDEFTIASQLQARFNAIFGSEYRVINLGRSAYFAGRELHLVQKTPLQPGDIVIFYDGIVDVGLGVNESPPETLPLQVCQWLIEKMPNLSLGKIYCLLTPGDDPTTDPVRWANDGQIVGSAYAKSILATQHYLANKRVQFYHFLQPNILSKSLSAYEQQIAGNPLLVSGDIRYSSAALAHNWPSLQAAQRQIQQSGVNSQDLTHVLDALRGTGYECYIDFYHVNELANGIIADAIFKAVVEI
jgi:hypothetical protein